MSFVSLTPVGAKHPTPPGLPPHPPHPPFPLFFLFFLFFGGVTRSGPSLFIVFIIISTILQKLSICPFICVLPHFYFLFV
nr:MAG TPA: hypothetical protein [Caudoviricetes sp.]